MAFKLSNTRWLDVAIKVVGVVLLLALVFLGYTVISERIKQANSSPAARAAANLADVVRKNPNNSAARLRYADALAAAGKLSEAAEQYKAALEIKPDDPQALAGLALLAMNQDEWRTAEGYWRKIVSLLEGEQYAAVDQRLEKAYYYLGSTLMEVKEYEEAANYLRQALRIRRDASDTYYLLAVAYREMGSELKYEENLKLALQFDPLLAEANYDYGRLLLSRGDVAGAAERFRVSADNAPPDRKEPAEELAKLGSAADHIAKAESFEASRDTSSAVSEARIASAIDPENVDAARLLAEVQEKAGNLAAARAAWERLLALVPDDPEATAAVKRLADVTTQQ